MTPAFCFKCHVSGFNAGRDFLSFIQTINEVLCSFDGLFSDSKIIRNLLSCIFVLFQKTILAF